MTVGVAAPVVFRAPLRPGNAGLSDTLQLIRGEITRGGKSLQVRADAEAMVRYAGPRDIDVIEAIFDGVLGIDQPIYGYDPLHVELLRTPESTQRAGRIDCDDFTIRAGALLESMGIQTRPVVWGGGVQTSAQPRFSHVYLQARDRQGKRWVDFDPVMRRVRPDARVGDRPPKGVTGTMINTPIMYGAMVQRRHAAQQLGDVGDLGFSFTNIVKRVGSAVNSASKVLDISDSRNPLRNIVSAIPVYGTAAVAAADMLAKGRKMVTTATGIDPAKVLSSAVMTPAKKSAPAPAANAAVVAKAKTIVAAPALQKVRRAPLPVSVQVKPIPEAPVSPPLMPAVPVAKAGMSTEAKMVVGLAVAGVVGSGLYLAIGRKGR